MGHIGAKSLNVFLKWLSRWKYSYVRWTCYWYDTVKNYQKQLF